MAFSGIAKNAAGQIEGYEIFIKYLPPQATEESLQDFFAGAGDVVGPPRLMKDGTGKCKGVAWVTFATEAAFKAALSWDGCAFDGGKHLSISAGKTFHTGIRPSVQAPGTHTPALCVEVVEKLVASDRDGVYVDGTFGRGGHSKAILAALSSKGSLHAFDMDQEAIVVGKQLMETDKRFFIHHAPFSQMKRILKPLGVKVAGAFFDLGISSPQFDDAGRGFRPEADGPLDLRFDQSRGVPASTFLQSVDREELIRIIAEYGETTDAVAARRIADAICLARSRGVLPSRTRDFAQLVAKAKGKEYQSMHPAKMTFQALRIHLNDEFQEMHAGIRGAFKLLGDGGRIGIITWKHSECAIVVDIFRDFEAVREDIPLLTWYRNQREAEELPNGWSMEMDDVVRPSERELQTNSRSRSALLHVLRKRRLPRMTVLENLAYALPKWSKAIDPARTGCNGKVPNDVAAEAHEIEESASKRRKTK